MARGCVLIYLTYNNINIYIYIYNLPSFLTFVEVDIDSCQLKFIVSNVFSGWINAMLSGHDLNFGKLVLNKT